MWEGDILRDVTDLSFSELLRHYRVKANLTQKDLADRAKLSSRVVSDLERGLRLPRRTTVTLLADALQLDPSSRTNFETSSRQWPHSTGSVEPRARHDSEQMSTIDLDRPAQSILPEPPIFLEDNNHQDVGDGPAQRIHKPLPTHRSFTQRYRVGAAVLVLLVGVLAWVTPHLENVAHGKHPGLTSRSTAGSTSLRWMLLAEDDFNGTTLDRSRWLPYQGDGGDGSGNRLPSNLKVSDGIFTLDAFSNGGIDKAPSVSGTCWCFAGSMQTYGRWEIRARMDNGSGYEPAVLLWPESDNATNDGVIDLITMSAPIRNHWTSKIDWFGSQPAQGHTEGGDFTKWHAYAVEWTADQVSFFLDDHKVWTETTPGLIPKRPMELALQINAGRGTPVPKQHVGLHVDWIKIYKGSAT